MSRDAPDYSFMKSGFNMVDSDDVEEMEQNVIVLVATFMNEGVKHAAYYLNHHPTRSVITSEDIKRGMMLEVFLFQNRPDLLERTDEIKALIYNSGEEADDDSDSDSDSDSEGGGEGGDGGVTSAGAPDPNSVWVVYSAMPPGARSNVLRSPSSMSYSRPESTNMSPSLSW